MQRGYWGPRGSIGRSYLVGYGVDGMGSSDVLKTVVNLLRKCL